MRLTLTMDFASWNRVAAEIEKTRKKFQWITEEIHFTEEYKFLTPAQLRDRWILFNSARYVADCATKLLRKGNNVVRLAPKRHKRLKPPTNTEQTFHGFQHLPTELRLMIWEAAAQPPPCIHYFANYNMTSSGGYPAAYIMEHGGLWAACRESRMVINRVSTEAYARVNKDGCSAKGKFERHYRRIGKFSRNARRLRELIFNFNMFFKVNMDDVGPLPALLINEVAELRWYKGVLCMVKRRIKWGTIFGLS